MQTTYMEFWGASPAPCGLAVQSSIYITTLTKCGFESFRYRHRIKGTKNRWSKGHRFWKHIRWLDPRVPSELCLLNKLLEEQRFPTSFSRRFSRLLEFISALLSSARPTDDTAVEGAFDSHDGSDESGCNSFGASEFSSSSPGGSSSAPNGGLGGGRGRLFTLKRCAQSIPRPVPVRR